MFSTFAKHPFGARNRRRGAREATARSVSRRDGGSLSLEESLKLVDVDHSRGLPTFRWNVTDMLQSRHFTKGQHVFSGTFACQGMPGMKMLFWPQGQDGSKDGWTSLALAPPTGWTVKCALLAGDQWDASSWRVRKECCCENGQGGGFQDFCPAFQQGVVGVEILEAVSPEGLTVLAGTSVTASGPGAVSTEVAVQSLKETAHQAIEQAQQATEEAEQAQKQAQQAMEEAKQAQQERDLALTALLKVQELEKDLLARAIHARPHFVYNYSTLLQHLREMGPDFGALHLHGPTDPLELKLAALVGHAPIKAQIRHLRRMISIDHRRRELKAPVLDDHLSHMIFKGNPGCGKTSVARLLAELLFDLKAVQNSSFVEVQRGDLVAGFVGQTALKTREKIEEAKGGVLFVDEAYRLSAGGSNDFGKEAIEEIMKDLTSGDPLVILAGYTQEMEQFLEANPGLKRRFPLVFDFPDYTPKELAEMFAVMAANAGFKLGPSVSPEAVTQLVEEHTTPSWRRKHNGGIADALLVRANDALSERLPQNFTKEAAETLELFDLRVAAQGLMTASGQS